MNKAEQRQFVENFMEDVKRALLSKSDYWPEGWNGVELRGLIFKAIAYEYDGLARNALKGNTVRGREFMKAYLGRDLYR